MMAVLSVEKMDVKLVDWKVSSLAGWSGRKMADRMDWRSVAQLENWMAGTSGMMTAE